MPIGRWSRIRRPAGQRDAPGLDRRRSVRQLPQWALQAAAGVRDAVGGRRFYVSGIRALWHRCRT
jgi:hypothetical protein